MDLFCNNIAGVLTLEHVFVCVRACMCACTQHRQSGHIGATITRFVAGTLIDADCMGVNGYTDIGSVCMVANI